MMQEDLEGKSSRGPNSLWGLKWMFPYLARNLVDRQPWKTGNQRTRVLNDCRFVQVPYNMHWALGVFFLRKPGFDMFWWHQLHSTSSLGVPGRTADRRWFQVCNDHRHGDLSGIVLANSGRGSLWFPPASKGYQFIYMFFFAQPFHHFFQRKFFWRKPSAGISWSVFPKKHPRESCGSPRQMICSKHFLRSRTSCHRCNQPPGQFLAGKSLHQNATAKMKPCTVASPQKGRGKSLVQCRIVRWYEMFELFDGWLVWTCDIYVRWSEMTWNFDACSWGGEA